MKVIATEPNSFKIKSGKIAVWVDVWEDNGEIMADWNKYIFHKDNADDMAIQKFQNDCHNFDSATELAIQTFQNIQKQKT